MRSDLTSGIVAALPAPGTFYGYLVEISANDGEILRYTSIDAGFDYAGFAWTPLDVDVRNVSWDGGVARTAKLVVGDVDIEFWVLALDYLLSDAPIRVWAVYNEAPNEAAPIFSGRIGKLSRNGLTVEAELHNASATTTAPRKRIQAIVDERYLLPGGKILNIGGQQWIINRPTSGAG